MSIVAVYNLKGGVGKTTTAVNLSYLAAAAGRRTLLWDLDPQAHPASRSASSRMSPDLRGGSRGRTLATAIKGTTIDSLDLLPADFAYRKLDRLLVGVGKPRPGGGTDLLNALGRDYDVVLLDCPQGFHHD